MSSSPLGPSGVCSHSWAVGLLHRCLVTLGQDGQKPGWPASSNYFPLPVRSSITRARLRPVRASATLFRLPAHPPARVMFQETRHLPATPQAAWASFSCLRPTLLFPDSQGAGGPLCLSPAFTRVSRGGAVSVLLTSAFQLPSVVPGT